MTTLAVITATLTLWQQPTPDPALVGRSTYYEGMTLHHVAAYRGIPLYGRVPVALNAAGDLGREAWLLWPDGSLTAAVSVDCAQRIHYQDRIDQGRVVEVPESVARARGFYGVGPVDVLVLFSLPGMRWM